MASDSRQRRYEDSLGEVAWKQAKSIYEEMYCCAMGDVDSVDRPFFGVSGAGGSTASRHQHTKQQPKRKIDAIRDFKALTPFVLKKFTDAVTLAEHNLTEHKTKLTHFRATAMNAMREAKIADKTIVRKTDAELMKLSPMERARERTREDCFIEQHMNDSAQAEAVAKQATAVVVNAVAELKDLQAICRVLKQANVLRLEAHLLRAANASDVSMQCEDFCATATRRAWS